MTTTNLHILGIIIVSVFILIKLSLGIFYLLKFPQIIINYKLNTVRKKYMLADESSYLSAMGKYNITFSICILIMFLTSLYFKKDIDPIIAIIFLLIMWVSEKKQKIFLLKKNEVL